MLLRIRTSSPSREQLADTDRGGLLDTCVVIALEGLAAEQLPEEPAISVLTLAELAAGPLATDDEGERARRQDRLQRVETLLDPLPFDAPAARVRPGLRSDPGR